MSNQRDKYASTSARPPVNRQGPGLVSLGVPKRTKSSAKLAVPKPVNLPSLKKENAGNDPTTQLVPSGQSGWSVKAEEQEHRAGSLVERSTWASGEPARTQHLPQAAWQRAGALNPSDFPSLAASATAKPQPPSRPHSDLHGQAGNWDEDERGYSHGPVQRSALIDRGEGGGRAGPQPGPEHAGYSHRDGGRYPGGEPGAYYPERGHGQYSRGEGSAYSRGARPEQPPYREWEQEGGYSRSGPYAEEGRPGGYGREPYAQRYERQGGPRLGRADFGSPSGMRHENDGRWGGYAPRLYDEGYNEGYREDFARGFDGGYDSRPPRYDRLPRPHQPPLATGDYDPELFPPMPAQPPAPGRARAEAGAERDPEREAFNAELERVAAELDRRKPAQGHSAGSRASGHSGERAERGWGYSSGEEGEREQGPAPAWGIPPASFATRAAAERRAAEEEGHEEQPRWEGAARKGEDGMGLREEEGEEEQRRTRKLADAQAAAHAALSKPPPLGAEPAFERRPTPPRGRVMEAGRVPQGGSTGLVPPPPPPPPPPLPRLPTPVEQLGTAMHSMQARAEEEGREFAMPLPQQPPAPQPPAPQPPASQPQPPQSSAAAVTQQPVAVAVSVDPEGPTPTPGPMQPQPPAPRPQTHAAPAARSPRAGQATRRPPMHPQQREEQQQQQPAPTAPAAVLAAPPAPAPAPAPAPGPARSSLVKPGSSWRAMLTGVPDAPAVPAGSAPTEQQGAQRGAASAGKEGKGRERESKRSKGRAGRQAAAAASAAAAPAAGPPPAPAADGSAAGGKGKGRGKGSKAQRAAAAAGGAPAAPDQTQQGQQAQGALAQRGARRLQQQVQREAAGGAGARTGRGAAKARTKGKGGGQAQAQAGEMAAAVGCVGAAVEGLRAGLESVAAAPVGGGQPVPVAAGGEAVALEQPEAPASAAAFGWSSPLADEVAKLQLSAAASADGDLAAEVAAAAAAAAGAGGGGQDEDALPAGMAGMMPLLDRDLLEPPPLRLQSHAGAAAAMPSAPAGLESLPAPGVPASEAGAGAATPAPAAPPPTVPSPVAVAVGAAVPSGPGLGDLLGDDVITALPADLTLDLATGGGASASGDAGSSGQPGSSPAAALQPSASHGFALAPPQRSAPSPAPFPGGLFPIPSIAVGAPNPWQLSAGPQDPSGVSLAAAAQSLYSLAQPHFTFGTHTNIPIPTTQPSSLAMGQPQYGQQQQEQQHQDQQHQQHAAAVAFGQQVQELPASTVMPFAQPGSFLVPSAAFIPTGRQPDWSTPQQGQGRTSPAPLPSYPPMPSPPAQQQHGDAVLQYSGGVSGAGVYGRAVPAQMPLPLAQYGQQQQQQYFDPAAALPDDVFGDGGSQGTSSIGLGSSGGAMSGPPPMRRWSRQDIGPPGRGSHRGPRYDGGGMGGAHPQNLGLAPPPHQHHHHQQQQQQHMFMMMNGGFPGRSGPGYGGRGSTMPPAAARQQHLMGGGGASRAGIVMPPPPPDALSPLGGRGGRARAGRAGRSGRGSNIAGPQPPLKNMYVPKQQQQQQAPAAPYKPAAEEAAA